MESWIYWFDDVGMDDVPPVGGKNASLGLFDERNEAVTRTSAEVIAAARAAGRKIGICGRAPSDYPEIAQFLVAEGIDSLSLNPDSQLKTMLAIADLEDRLAKGVAQTQSARTQATAMLVRGSSNS